MTLLKIGALQAETKFFSLGKFGRNDKNSVFSADSYDEKGKHDLRQRILPLEHN